MTFSAPLRETQELLSRLPAGPHLSSQDRKVVLAHVRCLILGGSVGVLRALARKCISYLKHAGPATVTE